MSLLAEEVREVNLGQTLLFQGKTAEETYPNIGTLISNILPNIYTAAGIVVLFLIAAGGLIMVLNSGNQDAQANGKKIITGAIIGLGVLFASYWIVQIIQVLTGIQILNSTL